MKKWITVLPVVAAILAGAQAPKAAAATQRWVDAPMSDWLEKITREKVTDGNKIELLVDGPEYFPVRLEMIRKTRQGDSIDFSTFLWCDDEAGLLVAEELAKAAGRGVRVRVYVDFMNFSKAHSKSYLFLESAGIKPLIFNPPYWGLGDINKTRAHEKIMIVNGEEALVGGANICSEYMTGKSKKLWHDLEFHVQGPVVNRMQKRFDENWNWMSDRDYQARVDMSASATSSGVEAAEHQAVHVERSFPNYPATPIPNEGKAFGEARALYEYQQPYRDRQDTPRFIKLFSELVKRAQHRVVMYSPYFVLPEELELALIETAQRGVQVTVMTNGSGTTDMGAYVAAAQDAHYGRFLHVGTRIYEETKTTLHAKALLIDDRVLNVGSHNFDQRAFLDQGEDCILTGDSDAIDKFVKMWQSDMANDFKQITQQDMSARTEGVKKGFWLIVGTWFKNLF